MTIQALLIARLVFVRCMQYSRLVVAVIVKLYLFSGKAKLNTCTLPSIYTNTRTLTQITKASIKVRYLIVEIGVNIQSKTVQSRLIQLMVI